MKSSDKILNFHSKVVESKLILRISSFRFPAFTILIVKIFRFMLMLIKPCEFFG